MIKIKKILYPTDFSEFAAYARPYVVEFAKAFSARVVIVHVATGPLYPVAYSISVDITSIEDDIKLAAQKKLDEEADEISKEGIITRNQLIIGDAYPEIVIAARTMESDIIIMATHGHGAIQHMLLGSTAEKVVRKAPCPVLTIRHPEHEFVLP